MEKLKITEQDGKRIDFEIETPERFVDFEKATGRIEMKNGEFQFIPRGNNIFSETSLTIEELQAIITKLRELNSQ